MTTFETTPCPEEGSPHLVDHEASIRNQCHQEAQRDDTEARASYQRSISRILNFRFCRLAAHGVSLIGGDFEQYQELWIDPSQVLFECDFSPYHHSPEEILDYCVQTRGDAELHLKSMPFSLYNSLSVQELPTPPGMPPLYTIAMNGNHRRVVFETLGLPKVRALVDPCEPEWWQARTNACREWVNVFHRVGLIPDIRERDDGSVTFADPSGLLGWVMPSTFPASTNVIRSANEIVCRLQSFESLVSRKFDAPPILHNLNDLVAAFEQTSSPHAVERFWVESRVRVAPPPWQGCCDRCTSNATQ
ncbi:hypothetical protein JRG19_10055 [Pseudoclavibacter alba]|uniref:hypothetical protein n=1 Tax=Pseudoclavibacter albus TaxID=272241 RepID=UPI0019CF5E2D|nr:hypothetical protein [Pseudoclavibacter alba]MBN6778872.1 hypothetical protein [Pseudoclavibacter alba]